MALWALATATAGAAKATEDPALAATATSEETGGAASGGASDGDADGAHHEGDDATSADGAQPEDDGDADGADYDADDATSPDDAVGNQDDAPASDTADEQAPTDVAVTAAPPTPPPADSVAEAAPASSTPPAPAAPEPTESAEPEVTTTSVPPPITTVTTPAETPAATPDSTLVAPSGAQTAEGPLVCVDEVVAAAAGAPDAEPATGMTVVPSGSKTTPVPTAATSPGVAPTPTVDSAGQAGTVCPVLVGAAVDAQTGTTAKPGTGVTQPPSAQPGHSTRTTSSSAKGAVATAAVRSSCPVTALEAGAGTAATTATAVDAVAATTVPVPAAECASPVAGAGVSAATTTAERTSTSVDTATGSAQSVASAVTRLAEVTAGSSPAAPTGPCVGPHVALSGPAGVAQKASAGPPVVAPGHARRTPPSAQAAAPALRRVAGIAPPLTQSVPSAPGLPVAPQPAELPAPMPPPVPAGPSAPAGSTVSSGSGGSAHQRDQVAAGVLPPCVLGGSTEISLLAGLQIRPETRCAARTVRAADDAQFRPD